MKTISAIIIAKNAEELIADCLDSVSFCNERIVIDAGSEDRTTEIAQRMGASVYIHKTNDFSNMRNIGLQKAKTEWVLYIDTDERITSQLAKEINNQINSNTETAVYKLKRKNFYFGNNEWPFIEHLERLFERKKLRGWKGELHESPLVEGQIGELNGFLLHYSHRDITSMVEKTNSWSDIEAKLRLRAGHPKMTWWRFLRVMTTAFFNSYITQRGWKAGTVGLIESIYQSFSIFITYAKLWEMQKKD